MRISTRAQRHLSSLVLILAAAAMVATSQDVNRIDASTSGSMTIARGARTASFTLRIEANDTVVQTMPRPIPWSASFDYSLRTTGPGQPSVEVHFEPLPEAAGQFEEGSGGSIIPEHPQACEANVACAREYLVTFKKIEPRGESVEINWSASAWTDWDDEDVPEGAALQMLAEGSEDQAGPEPRTVGEIFSQWFTIDAYNSYRPVRFIKPAGVRPGTVEVKIATTVGGDSTTSGNFVLLPDEGEDPRVVVEVGTSSSFNPFQRCTTAEECVVGYSIELRPEKKYEDGAWLESGVVLSTATEGIDLRVGGVVLESVPAQVDEVLTGATDGFGNTWDLSITNASLIPPGTPIEVESLIEASIADSKVKAPVTVETRFGYAVLTPEDPEDAATGVYLERCVTPCTTGSIGAINLRFPSSAEVQPTVEYKLTLRLRLIGLDEVPDGVGLEVRDV